MKYVSCILLFLIAHAASAYVTLSKLDLEWEAPTAVFSPVDSALVPYFANATYNDDGMPVLHLSFEADNNADIAAYTITLDSCKFAACDSVETAYLTNKNVSSEISINKYKSTYKRQGYIELDICPIILSDGTYKKLLQAGLSVHTPPTLRSSEDESSIADRYATSSVLAEGQWVKIAVENTGIYKLTYEQLAAMGFSNPENVAIYGYGGAILEENFGNLETLARPEDDLPETAIYMNTGSDGVFSSGDYILFYAQGVVKTTFNNTTNTFTSTQNYYSSKAYYFITTKSNGKKIEQKDKVSDSYDLSISSGLMHYCLLPQETNLLKSGRLWYGYKFSSAQSSRQLTLPFSNIDTSSPISVSLQLSAYSTGGTSYYNISLDGTSLGTASIYRITDTSYQIGRLWSGTYSSSVTTANNPVLSLSYSYNSSSDYGYIVSVNATAMCGLVMSEGTLPIYYPYDRNTYEFARYVVSGTDSNTAIWNISDPLNISQVYSEQDGSTTYFTAEHSQDYNFLAVNTAYDFPAPETIGTVANQNLHALEQCDYVIISSPAYLSYAETLAQMHRDKDGMTVHIVTPEQVYNEFSSGTPDATAVRWFMKMFYDRAAANESKQPKYLLFFGRCYYDNRGIENSLVSDMVSFQSEESMSETSSYQTDDYFGMLDDDECAAIRSDRMDIGVGRLPVESVSEAADCVNKIIAYSQNTSFGKWKNTFIFVGDDNDNNEHSKYADQLAERMRSINKSYNADKIYLDTFEMEQTTQGSTFPDAKEKLLEDLQTGALFFNYMGHGSSSNLAHEVLLSRSDVKGMTSDNLAFWLIAACDVGRYDTPNSSSIGLDMILNANGASVATLTSNRVVYSSDNRSLCLNIMNYVVPSEEGDFYRLGDIVSQAKGDLGLNTNKLKYNLMGDPALMLNYPEYKAVITEINDADPTDAQMKALGVTTLKGSIQDYEGNVLSDFNGSVYITIYDKEEEITSGCHKVSTPVVYDDFIDVLFRGTVSVTNGTFSTTFMVPKDINYSLGTGRINMYAANSDNSSDANGYNEDFTVGGSDENTEETDEGPQMRIYMNTPSFVSGQTVNPSPVFYAQLYDTYGINTSGAGIGHDITMNLNGTTYTLNDYYTSNLDDYTSGTVKYQFSDLEEGQYDLTFKAWNMQNISATASLSFVVADDAKATISSFYAYPNPASTELTLSLEYDRPGNVVEVSFYVYTLTGNLCYQTKADINTEGVYSVTWDLENGTGSGLGDGLYLVKAKVVTQEETETSNTIKILIDKQ